MKYIEQNKKEFEICGILKWHEFGYTGKGIKIAEIEPARPDLWFFDGKLRDPFGNGTNAQYNCHGQKVLDVMHQVAPDAELYSLYSGIITKGKEVSGNFIEQTLPFAIQEGIHIIGASLGGINHPALNEKIKEAQEHGVIFTTSAGNEGKQGLGGFAESGVWIAIGAIGYSNSKKETYLKDYSSIGKELDVVGFSGLYVHDGRPGYENRVFQQEGTSFSNPFVAGMIALVQQYFLERTGRTLYQDEMQQFIYDHTIDLGTKGFDVEYGYGLFVLPEPESIDVSKYLLHRKEVAKVNKPEYIIIHHSLTDDNVLLSDFEAIRRYHMQMNGWRDIGYHWVLEKVNNKWAWRAGRKETEDGAHCKEQGMNFKSVGICVVGNFDKDTPTDEIYELVAAKCKDIMSRWPKIKVENIKPHREYATYKSCPGKNFDMNAIINRVKEVGSVIGETIKTQYAPIQSADGKVTYLQVREIIEAAGGAVHWVANDKPIEIDINNCRLLIEVGKKQVTRIKNGVTEVIKTKYAPIQSADKKVTYLQIREIIEIAGGAVNWVSNTKPIEVIINGYKLTIEIGKNEIQRIRL